MPGGYSFCIDAHEVTNAEYAKFENSATLPPPTPPPVAGEAVSCAWKTSYKPGIWPGVSTDSVDRVDWCDAYAYCKFVGKRLCTSVGGPLASWSPANDEWSDACLSGNPGLYDMLGGVSDWTGVCGPGGPGSPAPPFDIACDYRGGTCNNNGASDWINSEEGGIRCCAD